MSWQAKQASPPAWSPACCAALAAGVAFPERAGDTLPPGSAVPSSAALATNAIKNRPTIAAFHPLFGCGMVCLLDSVRRSALSLPKGGSAVGGLSTFACAPVNKIRIVGSEFGPLRPGGLSRDFRVGIEPAELLPVVFLELAQDNGVQFALFALDVLAEQANQVASQGQELAELAGGVEVKELAAEFVEGLAEDVVLVAQLAHQAP